jgi:hypothetical protein
MHALPPHAATMPYSLHHGPPSHVADDIVPPGQPGVLLKVVPERDWHAVEVQWVVPPEIRQYRAQPCGYLSHLLG